MASSTNNSASHRKIAPMPKVAKQEKILNTCPVVAPSIQPNSASAVLEKQQASKNELSEACKEFNSILLKKPIGKLDNSSCTIDERLEILESKVSKLTKMFCHLKSSVKPMIQEESSIKKGNNSA